MGTIYYPVRECRKGDNKLIRIMGGAKNILIILILNCLLIQCNSSRAKLQSDETVPPNIILVMADDLGYECLGSYGGLSYGTPNLDKIAAGGMSFSHAYSQPLCTNTRTELMTGKYLHRNWVAFGILDPAERTFGHLMRDRGYASCIVGKWQLQSYDPPDYPGAGLRRGIGMHPRNAGFDEYCLWHTGHTEDKGSRYANPVILQNGEFLQGTEGRYGPDIFTTYLNEFVKRNADRPFFVYYPMALPHGPFVATPDSDIWIKTEMRHSTDTAYFGDMVRYCDKIMGQIHSNLVETGLEENTLLIFYSDNGTHQSIYSNMNGHMTRGGKGLTNNAGIRVPLIASWKGVIRPGSVNEDMIYSCDFLPTFLELAGSVVPRGKEYDGESILPLLKGEKIRRKDWIYTDFNPRPGWDKDQFRAVRYVFNRDYKLYGDGRFYRWSDDLLEEEPLEKESLDPRENKVMDRFQFILDSIPGSQGEYAGE